MASLLSMLCSMTPFLVMGFVFVLLIIRSILVAQRTVAARGILLRVSSTALASARYSRRREMANWTE